MGRMLGDLSERTISSGRDGMRVMAVVLLSSFDALLLPRRVSAGLMGCRSAAEVRWNPSFTIAVLSSATVRRRRAEQR
jgi:hypothetical protein